MNRELNTWRDVIQAMLDGEEVEAFNESSGKWEDVLYFPRLHITLLGTHGMRCRLKPRTIMIGEVGVPEPVRDASELEEDEKYFAVSVGSKGYCSFFHWDGDDFDLRMLRRGLIHKTKEAATLHSKALIKISGGNYE